MAIIWKADATLPTGDEFRALDAYDFTSESDRAGDPSNYTGTRVTQVSSQPWFPGYSGSKAYKMTVMPGDGDFWTSTAQRTEVGQINNGNPPPGVDRTELQGQERWRAFWVHLNNYPTDSGWFSFQQNKGEGTGNGPISFYFENGTLYLKKSGGQTYGSANNLTNVWSGNPSRTKPIKLCLGVNWSTGSDGWYELWGNLEDGQGYRQLKARTNGWTLKYGSSGGPVRVGFRFGLYRLGRARENTLYFAGITLADTRVDAETGAQFSTGGGVPPPPPPPPPATTRALATLVEDFSTTGPELPTRIGNVAVTGSAMRLMIDANVTQSYARTIQDLLIPGDGVIAGPITWPGRSTGTGTLRPYLTVDVGANNRFVLIRNTTYDAAGTVTLDQAECRLVTAGIDQTPVLVNWSTLTNPTLIKYLKIGFGANNDTVIYQVSTDGVSYQPVAERAIPTSIDVTNANTLAFVELGYRRNTGDTILGTTYAVDNLTGTNNPAASGATVTKTDVSLVYSGTAARVFPTYTGAHGTFLALIRPDNFNRQQTPIAQSATAGAGGRMMLVTTQAYTAGPNVAGYHDFTLTPTAGFSAGTIPTAPAWVLVAVSQTQTGKITVRTWDAATGLFTHTEDAGTLTLGAAITDTAARLVLGNHYPISIGSRAFQGRMAMAAILTGVITASQFEALVSTGGVITQTAVANLPGLARGYSTINATATTQIQDFSANLQHELTAQQLGTFTTNTTTADVPYALTGSSPSTPPSPQPSVPQASGLTITDARITPNTTTGQATLTINATAVGTAITYTPNLLLSTTTGELAAISFTPNTTPYGFFYSSTDPNAPLTQYGTWQTSNTITVTGQPLDPGDGSQTRYWTARYRNNNTPPLEGEPAPFRPLTIEATPTQTGATNNMLLLV